MDYVDYQRTQRHRKFFFCVFFEGCLYNVLGLQRHNFLSLTAQCRQQSNVTDKMTRHGTYV